MQLFPIYNLVKSLRDTFQDLHGNYLLGFVVQALKNLAKGSSPDTFYDFVFVIDMIRLFIDVISVLIVEPKV